MTWRTNWDKFSLRLKAMDAQSQSTLRRRDKKRDHGRRKQFHRPPDARVVRSQRHQNVEWYTLTALNLYASRPAGAIEKAGAFGDIIYNITLGWAVPTEVLVEVASPRLARFTAFDEVISDTPAIVPFWEGGTYYPIAASMTLGAVPWRILFIAPIHLLIVAAELDAATLSCVGSKEIHYA